MSKKCFHCIKIAVVVINFVLFLIGIAILGSSIFLYMKTTDYDLVRSPNHYSEFKRILAIIIGLGIFTIVLSSVGCVGAYHESQIVLAFYFSIMLLLFANQIAVGSLYFGYKEEKLSVALKNIIENYKKNKISNSEEHMLHLVQKMLMCCGVDGVDDYSVKTKDTPKLPDSCCNYMNFECKKNAVDKKNAFTKGCKDGYKDFSQHKLGVISMIIVIMSIIEFLGMLFSISLCYAIRYSFNNNGYIAVTRSTVI